jgi:peptide/nickel transport system ATP-binding protein
MSVLEVSSLVVDYARRGLPPVRAVADVTFALARGEVMGLVGESGCGKSTLARAVVGLVRPTSGTVVFEGRPVDHVGYRRRSRDQVRLQMVFQDSFSSLNPRRRIGLQILDGVVAEDGRRGRERRAGELLELVGLPASYARRYPHEFSGGQRQRIAIARALAAEPSVLVADEIVASLDASTQAQITNLVDTLARELDLAVLFISHDLAIVRHICDTVAVMYLGRLAEVAPADELWASPLHPYTRALIDAFPLLDGQRRIPRGLEGDVPDPSRPPTGCRLRPRCPSAFERCVVEPELVRVADGRRAACWLHAGGADQPT